MLFHTLSSEGIIGFHLNRPRHTQPQQMIVTIWETHSEGDINTHTKWAWKMVDSHITYRKTWWFYSLNHRGSLEEITICLLNKQTVKVTTVDCVANHRVSSLSCVVEICWSRNVENVHHRVCLFSLDRSSKSPLKTVNNFQSWPLSSIHNLTVPRRTTHTGPHPWSIHTYGKGGLRNRKETSPNEINK